MRTHLPVMLISILVAAGCVSPRSQPDLLKPSEPWLVGEPETTEPRQVDEGGLTLSASPTKERYFLGEPVYLSLRLTNRGEQPLSVHPYLEPGEGAIAVEIRTPGADERVFDFVPLGESDDDAEPISLAPGAVVGTTFGVFFGGLGWTFVRPGTWTARVVYDGPGGQAAASESIRIEVTDDETGAGDYLMTSGAGSWEAGKFLVWESGDHLRRGQAHLLRLIERYPGSALSHYAEFTIGKSLSHDFLDYSVGRRRPPDCTRSREHLERADLDVLPANLDVQWHLARARCAAIEGDGAALEGILGTVRQLLGDRPEYRGLESQVDRLEQVKR